MLKGYPLPMAYGGYRMPKSHIVVSLWEKRVACLSTYWRVKPLRAKLRSILRIHTIGGMTSSHVKWRRIAFYARCVRRL